VTIEQQRADPAIIDLLNQRHLQLRNHDDELNARVKGYELAFRMQTEAPEFVRRCQRNYWPLC